MKRSIAYIYSTIFLIILFISCGVSRNEAARLVEDSSAFKTPKAVIFKRSGSGGQHVVYSDQIDPIDSPVEARLQQAGLLYARGGYIMRTDKFLYSSQPDVVIPPSMSNTNEAFAILAHRVFVTITGVNREASVMRVEFQWHWKPTELGSHFLSPPSGEFRDAQTEFIDRQLEGIHALVDPGVMNTSVIRFRKFDTGWREEDNQFLPQ